MTPHFRPAHAPVTGHKTNVRWPGPFSSGFLSPQPPGAVGIGPIHKPLRRRANESWSFLLFSGGFEVCIRLRSAAGVHRGARTSATRARGGRQSRDLAERDSQFSEV